MPTTIFQTIEALNPQKSLSDNSFEHTTTMDMGKGVPIMVKEAVPGDIWKMSMRMIIRMAPMIAPILHPINAKTFTFFVPNRLLFPKRKDPTELADINHNWENFITGGEDGQDDSTLKRWAPNTGDYETKESLWDYLGLPMVNLPTDSQPNLLALRAINLIWNEYIRDQNTMDWRDLDDSSDIYFCWEKDYFTTALPWQQRGTTPALPLSGLGAAEFTGIAPNQTIRNSATMNPPSGSYWSNTPIISAGQQGSSTTSIPAGTELIALGTYQTNPSGGGTVSSPIVVSFNQAFTDWLNTNQFDMSQVGTFDVSDLRTAFQTQKWLERNARAGGRYKEQLEARFGETAGDARLDRPEFIGGTKTPVIISEVLQTAQNPTPTGGQPSSQLGTMAGHGITADGSEIGTYRVQEHGWIITLLVIRPETSYIQGIDPQFTRRTKFDFLTPEFVNLSEQPVYNREIMGTTDETYNATIFGWQERYNEYRYTKNMVTGKMRDDFAHWHLARLFSDTSRPALNEDFQLCKPDKRIFAVPSEPGFFINYGAINETVRPLPIHSQPGLVDHH
jgi:hypothetical protein